ncbi:hypothetical protein EJC47_11115 [Sphingomonas sp. TF3]|uniref:hypothetical protein n=1 Tax=Sphingomonas sp. TF3 TaxID=2495580 RepID=UPI000F88E750|nr:hypothetical protein [Sphingomonas sp. TF3]RUN76513.1 hypothetical protein EJC47_11115 [Sphingomonas sp. TF3]
MQRKMTGSDIVASLAKGRPWWQLRASDVQPWVQSLHHSAVQELTSRTEWIGEAWDGKSDIQVGSSAVLGSEVASLLRKLRRGIKAARLDVVGQPDSTSIRQCYGATRSALMLVVDIDLGDVVLPLGIWEWQLRDSERPSISKIADNMLSIIGHALSMRDRLIQREFRLRKALQETVAKIGTGVAPLWLRMNPFPINENPKYLIASPYLMCIISLNDCLEWTPTGDEQITTVRDIRKQYRWLARYHRPRAQTLDRLVATGSQGSIDELSLAIIAAQGLNPGDVFRLAHQEALTDRRGSVQFHRPDRPQDASHRDQLYYRDGRLKIIIGFDGGVYTSDVLSVWGDFPETVAHAARGKRLDQFVDHAAFRETGIVVKVAETRQGALDLNHRLRSISIEEAERRWMLAAK